MNEKDSNTVNNIQTIKKNSNDNKKQQRSIILPRSSISQDKILLKRRSQSSDKTEKFLNREVIANAKQNIATIKKCKSEKNLKRVTFNSSIEVINIIEFKNETKNSSYKYDFENEKEEEENTEKKCLICIIY